MSPFTPSIALLLAFATLACAPDEMNPGGAGRAPELPEGMEELLLPELRYAVEDSLPPDQRSSIVNVQYDGRITIEREVYYDPEIHDGRAEPNEDLAQWLAVTAQRMARRPLDEEAGTGPPIPDEPLMIAADRTAAFVHIRRILDLCASKGVLIWKIQLAAFLPAENGPRLGRIAVALPRGPDGDPPDAEPVETIEIRMRVREPGEKLKPIGKDVTRPLRPDDTGRFDYGPDRELEYTVWTFRTTDPKALGERLKEIREQREASDEAPLPAILDPRTGIIWSDVATVLDEVIEAGFTDIEFADASDEGE